MWLHYLVTHGIAVEDSFKEGDYGASTGKLAGGLNNASSGVIDASLGNEITQYINLLEWISNKTGELANTENDSAIVFAPGGDYIFCVMSDRVSAGNAQKEIQEMSRIIYEKLGENE